MNHVKPVVHHMMRAEEPDVWPTEIRAVFAAVGDAMNGSRVATEMLAALSCERDSVIAGHNVSVTHLSAREIMQRRGCYIVTIDGPQVHGTWRLVSGPTEHAGGTASKH
jgi:hypothetical protein